MSQSQSQDQTATGRAMAMSQTLRTVRQIRQYESTPVPPEVLEELLQIARWTGSSRNSQPWHFLVIDDQETLQQISQLRTPINWAADAPVAIAIVLEGDKEVSEAYDEGRVTERLLIGAHAFGLGGGTAWFGEPPLQEKAKEILGIPKEHTARSMVTIGYPVTARDPRPNRAQGGRKPLSEIVSYNRMGQSRG